MFSNFCLFFSMVDRRILLEDEFLENTNPICENATIQWNIYLRTQKRLVRNGQTDADRVVPV